MSIVGARIRSLREDQDLEVGQLAYKARVNKSYLHYIERGERPNVSGVILARIADALNTSTDYLLGRTGIPAPPDGRQGPDPRILHDAETLAGVSPRVRQYALEICEIFQELEEIAPDLLEQAVNIIATQAEFVKLATTQKPASPQSGAGKADHNNNPEGEHQAAAT
jgi:transcriptional regulator with XRE-family HTH domain